MDSRYIVKDAEALDTPALLLYEEQVKFNIAQMAKLVGGVGRLRPHVKTHKCREVLALQRAAGIDRFKCATIKEAEMVAEGGAAELLLAYPITGPLARRAAELQKRYPRLQLDVLADNPLHVRTLGDACRAAGVELGVLIDVNPGLDRTGTAGSEVDKLARMLGDTPGLRFAGLHSYGSRPAQGSYEERRPVFRQAIQTAVDARRALERAGIRVPRLVAGGSIDCFTAAEMDAVDELSPGTFVFWDKGYEDIFPGRFAYAALVLGRVMSRPTSTVFAVDAGYKSVSADPPIPHCEVLSVPGSAVIGRWEEHLQVRLAEPSPAPEVGALVYIAPVHVCSTINLWDEALVVNGRGEIAGRWAIAARGH
jgi:D-serine deaminase-like pyridoxal phosphate-dependent protein